MADRQTEGEKESYLRMTIYDNKTLKSQHFAREKNPKGHIDFVMVHPKKHQSFANQGNKLSLDVCTVKG